MNDLLIPRGFRLIALTEMPGTGGVEGRGYYNEDTKQLYFTLIDPASDAERAFGPVHMRTLPTLVNVLTDVVEMAGKNVRYIEEEEL